MRIRTPRRILATECSPTRCPDEADLACRGPSAPMGDEPRECKGLKRALLEIAPSVYRSAGAHGSHAHEAHPPAGVAWPEAKLLKKLIRPFVGTRPPTRSSTTSPRIAHESLTQGTSPTGGRS